jgi:hypothetical protein
MLILPVCMYGQYEKYSIDHGKVRKSGNINLKEHVERWKINRALNKEGRDFYKEIRKSNKRRKKYRRELQDREVIKRMKKSEKVAKRNNKNKPNLPLYVRLIRKLEKAYGRIH